MKYFSFKNKSTWYWLLMADDHASKQKTKHERFPQKHKRQMKQRTNVIQPRLPKTASEVSSNWKALAAVIEIDKESKKTIKRKRSANKPREFTGKKSIQKQSQLAKRFKNDVKSGKDEIWFDDVDADDIEKATGVKQKKLSKSDNVHTHAHMSNNEVQQNEAKQQEPRISKHVAMDCEFVGVGKDGLEHMMARVSIVNMDCEVLYDKYVAAQERVVDYRTDVSGIRPFHLRNAPKFVDVQKEVAALIKDKILIGHSISTDLKVLLLDHPRKRIRDTAKYKPFQEKVRTKRPSLKRLAKEMLSLAIQTDEHSSVEDASAAMKLYRAHRKEWEKSIKDKFKKTKIKPNKSFDISSHVE